MSHLDVVDLAVRVGPVRLIADLSANVLSGSFVGLVGPNGSGKSTLLRTIYRVLRQEAGAVLIDGVDTDHIGARAMAQRVSVMEQEPPGDIEYTAAEMVMLGRVPHQRALRGATAVDRDIVAAALRDVHATHLADRSWRTLSGGEKQRLLLARSIAQGASVLILDEPTNHLDVRHQFELLARARELGITTLAALHDLNLAAQHCDGIIVLDAGRIVATGPPDEVLTSDIITPVFGVTVDRVTHPRTGAIQLLFAPLDADTISRPSDHPTDARTSAADAAHQPAVTAR